MRFHTVPKPKICLYPWGTVGYFMLLVTSKNQWTRSEWLTDQNFFILNNLSISRRAFHHFSQPRWDPLGCMQCFRVVSGCVCSVWKTLSVAFFCVSAFVIHSHQHERWSKTLSSHGGAGGQCSIQESYRVKWTRQSLILTRKGYFYMWIDICSKHIQSNLL